MISNDILIVSSDSCEHDGEVFKLGSRAIHVACEVLI